MLTVQNLNSMIYQKVKVEKEKKKLEELYKLYDEVHKSSRSQSL